MHAHSSSIKLNGYAGLERYKSGDNFVLLFKSYENEILVFCFCCYVGRSGPTDALEKQFPDVYCVKRIRIIPISEICIFKFV